MEDGWRRPEPPDLPLAEQVVAGEQLVGALSREDDLDARVADQPRQQEQRRRRGAQERSLGVRDDLRERLRDVLAPDHDLLVIALDQRGDGALMTGLVVLGVLEADREGAEPVALHPPAQRRDQRAVESSREVAPDRHVRAEHAKADRLLERTTDALDGLLDGASKRRGLLARVGRQSRTPGPRCRRREIVRTCPGSSSETPWNTDCGGDHRPEGERLGQADWIEGPRESPARRRRSP